MIQLLLTTIQWGRLKRLKLTWWSPHGCPEAQHSYTRCCFKKFENNIEGLRIGSKIAITKSSMEGQGCWPYGSNDRRKRKFVGWPTTNVRNKQEKFYGIYLDLKKNYGIMLGNKSSKVLGRPLSHRNMMTVHLYLCVYKWQRDKYSVGQVDNTRLRSVLPLQLTHWGLLAAMPFLLLQ
jgi:hypothetical protein